jgi:putative SOS response-associated peptidase YedK
MSQRYVLPSYIDAEREFVPAQSWWKFAPHFNVAPTQYVPAMRMHDGKTEGSMMRWGFIPSWAEGKAAEDPATHVAADRIEGSQLYRGPWLESQRCILPMAGFYVWHRTPEGFQQPHYVRLIDRAVFGVAAIWDASTTEDDEVIESCSMIKVPANPLVGEIQSGSRRMPAVLRRRDYQIWLSGTPVQARSVLQTYPEKWMQANAVSPRVNSLQNNDPSLIQPIGTEMVG